jgi:hypothetical protein
VSNIKVNCMMQAAGFAVRAICNAITAASYRGNEEEHTNYLQRMHGHLRLMDDTVNHALGEN